MTRPQPFHWYRMCTHYQPTATASSGQRLGQLRALVASSDNHGIVALDDNMFQQFAFAQARPYHIVVLLTSKQQTECSMCRYVQQAKWPGEHPTPNHITPTHTPTARQMESEFRVLAQAVEQLHVKPSNIFLAEADYDDNKRAFMTVCEQPAVCSDCRALPCCCLLTHAVLLMHNPVIVDGSDCNTLYCALW